MLEKISGILGILAFIMSSASWVVKIINERINLTLKVLDYEKRGHKHTIQIFFMIENNSQLPISLTSIKIANKPNMFVNCELRSKPVYTHIIRDDWEIVKQEKLQTSEFPITIPSLVAVSGAIEFVNCPDIELDLGKSLSFRIYTTRGRVDKKIILADREIHLRKKF